MSHFFQKTEFAKSSKKQVDKVNNFMAIKYTKFMTKENKSNNKMTSNKESPRSKLISLTNSFKHLRIIVILT